MSSKTGAPANNWKGVMRLAEELGARYPELVAAQWALESDWGRKPSGRHNYVGLKGPGTKTKTQEHVNGNFLAVDDDFLDFDSLGECLDYLVSRWYKDYKNYKGVNGATSRREAAWRLVREGYATDPRYAEKLVELMDQQEPAPSGGGVRKAALFRLEAVQETWLKKGVGQAEEFGEGERKRVGKGQGYGVVRYTELAGQGHAEVELAAGAGVWFVFEPHWRKVQRLGEAIPARVDWSDFNCLVTPHLTVGEVLQFDRRRIPPEGASVRGRILRTAQQFELIRAAWGGPLGVTSWYRPEPINQQVGGVPNSWHTKGQAFDIYPVGRSLESFYQWVRVRWTGGLGDGRNRGFLHLDTQAGGHFVPGAGAVPVAQWVY